MILMVWIFSIIHIKKNKKPKHNDLARVVIPDPTYKVSESSTQLCPTGSR
jgi:hypothetical protein